MGILSAMGKDPTLRPEQNMTPHREKWPMVALREQGPDEAEDDAAGVEPDEVGDYTASDPPPDDFLKFLEDAAPEEEPDPDNLSGHYTDKPA